MIKAEIQHFRFHHISDSDFSSFDFSSGDFASNVESSFNHNLAHVNHDQLKKQLDKQSTLLAVAYHLEEEHVSSKTLEELRKGVEITKNKTHKAWLKVYNTNEGLPDSLKILHKK